MKRTISIILTMFVMMLGIVACQAETAAEPTAVPQQIDEAELTPDQILTLGDVSNEPVEKIEELTPIAEYLAAQLADQGIVKAEVIVAPEIDDMVEYLESGQVDLYFDSPYAALTVYEEAGAVPLLRRWRKGIGEYHTNIVVLQDSGLSTIDDLLGQVIAFERPDSSTGSRMPQAHLVNLGYEMVEVESTDDPWRQIPLATSILAVTMTLSPCFWMAERPLASFPVTIGLAWMLRSKINLSLLPRRLMYPAMLPWPSQTLTRRCRHKSSPS